MREIELTEEQTDHLREVARRTDAWPLEDRNTLRGLRADLRADDVLRPLAADIRAGLDEREAVLIHGTLTDSDSAIVGLFQTAAVPSDFGNGDGFVHTVAPKESDQADLSETPREFPPHTDSTFLRDPHNFVALACVERAPDSGGDSTLVHLDAVSAALRDGFGPEVLADLGEPAYPFVLRDPLYGDGVQLVPIIDDSGPSAAIRYRRDVLDVLVAQHPDVCEERHARAVAALGDVLDDGLAERFRLDPGDMLIIDNRRVLHGRTAIKPGASRVLRRLKGFATAGPDFEVLV